MRPVTYFTLSISKSVKAVRYDTIASMNEELREELIEMVGEDQVVRERLASDGSLFEGYHPEMQAVHEHNARRLEAIIEEFGWPGKSLVGEDSAEAAWLIAQHAISLPSFERKCLALLREAVEKGEAPARHAAYLTDRIRFHEGKTQVYGTQYDWDERGELSPGPMENAEGVDERRRIVGLGPLQTAIEGMRKHVAASNEMPPADFAERRKKMEAWARSVGWRD